MLLILSQGVSDRARVLAGKATIALKLPVSLQIVLRALIEEGLKRSHPFFLTNVADQAREVRHKRHMARRASVEGGGRESTVRRGGADKQPVTPPRLAPYPGPTCHF